MKQELEQKLDFIIDKLCGGQGFGEREDGNTYMYQTSGVEEFERWLESNHPHND